MNKEDKELLLKDLSARLPYGVMVKTPYNNAELIGINGIVRRKGYTRKSEYIDVITDKQTYPIRYVKPYLRPLSSMTEKEIDELKELCTMYEPSNSPNIGFEDYGIRVLTHHLSDDSISFLVNMKVIDWLNSHHFDYRGLIEKGLAIKVTEDNNPYEN